MIRKKKNYSRPKKMFEISRIKEENALLEKYALKSKREVWKTIAKVRYFRKRAMALARASSEEQQVLFNKLSSLGLKVNSIADVLALSVNNLLERRLPTIVAKKGLANTPQQARQMVVHKRVFIDNKVVSIPSYIVSVDEESKITALQPKKPQVKESKEEAKAEDKESNGGAKQ